MYFNLIQSFAYKTNHVEEAFNGCEFFNGAPSTTRVSKKQASLKVNLSIVFVFPKGDRSQILGVCHISKTRADAKNNVIFRFSVPKTT